VLGEELPRDAKAHSLDAAPQLFAEIWHGDVCRGRIERVIARTSLEHQGTVLDRPRHWPRMVEVPGKGEDARTADAPVSGFHAHDAAAKSRPAYGSARVGPHRTEGKPCGHRRPRTAARPSGVNLRVPGVAGGLEVRSQCGRTSRELVGGQLPEKQPSGL